MKTASQAVKNRSLRWIISSAEFTGKSASAAEAMNAQAEQLKAYVGDMLAAITGSGRREDLQQMPSGRAVRSVGTR